MTRSREAEEKYLNYKKSKDPNICDFCNFKGDQLIESKIYFNIVRNIFGYEIWDSCSVIDHLMVSPKRHIESTARFSSIEKLEYMDIITEYESIGYSIYS